MSDCPNVEIRELLPDYLSGTLAAPRRVEVEGHVAGCQDCQDELAVLRLVREAYAESAPAVNVGAIVSALPRPSLKPVIKPAMKSWRRSYMQIAAAVSFVALGGLSLAVARSFFNGGAVVPDTVTAVAPAVASGEGPAISFAGGVSDLEDEDLEALLSALESIEALPVTEPTELPVSTGRQGS